MRNIVLWILGLLCTGIAVIVPIILFRFTLFSSAQQATSTYIFVYIEICVAFLGGLLLAFAVNRK